MKYGFIEVFLYSPAVVIQPDFYIFVSHVFVCKRAWNILVVRPVLYSNIYIYI
jgi:hypothetical protein